jgi:hypothetical protein
MPSPGPPDEEHDIFPLRHLPSLTVRKVEKDARGASFMRADRRKVRELLEEYASLIPLAGEVPPEDKARMRDLERELLKHGCILDFDLDLLVS